MSSGAGESIPWHELFESDALRVIRNATVPIYCSTEGGEPQFNRSAVLLRVDNDYFLLTAMHSLPRLVNLGFRFLTQPGDGDTTPVDISGGKLSGFGEPVDIGAVRVTATAVQRMGKGISALTLKDLDVERDWDATTPFMLCGYPKALETQKPSKTGPMFIPRSFTYLTSGYEGPLETPENFSRDVHLSVTWSKDFECASLDGKDVIDDGGLTATPKPGGISGGGIWRCGFRAGHDQLAADKKYRCKLSAIQHTVHRGIDYAIGTRTGMALYAIWRDHPGLRPAIEQVFPNAFPIIPPA